jgi:hypothetical protein
MKSGATNIVTRSLLIVLALALCFAGWMNLRDYEWTPPDAPRWNPFAIKESGIGRTFARILTEQANTSYHHGLLEQRPPLVANPFSQWLDAGTVSLGFQGRLRYRPVEQYPLPPYEVKQALDQAEKNLRLAFELDPGNCAAYDVYLFFLTNEITQTEFASMNGTQLQDDDDEEQATPGSSTHAGQEHLVVAPGGRSKDSTTGANKENKDTGVAQQLPNAVQRWVEGERERRHQRAIEITDEAIRKFRPNTEDPERVLTGAVMWYNRFLLLAPEPAECRRSVAARRKFEQIGRPVLEKMKYYILAARVCENDLQQKGLWETIPERRKEFLQAQQLTEGSAAALAIALQNNRALIGQGPVDSTVLCWPWQP